MLIKNIFIQLKIITSKFIYFLTIIIMLSCAFLSIMNTKVNAAQYTEKYNSSTFKTSLYPGYLNLIDNLKKIHPNWTFTILYTGLDWNQVLKNETTAAHGRNLVSKSKTGEWVCPICGNKTYDSGNWKCASETTVAYYMDPRNSLFEDYIFQFENLKWIDGLYTVSGVNKIISDCKYLQGNKVIYTTTDNKTATINKSYAQIIYDAAKKNNISPYHLASRIRQEQGAGKNASATATGKYNGYIGYYNFCNIGASGSGSSTVIKNGLEYAKKKGWNNPQKSIEGGAAFLASSYINVGQNTAYLQKFDVDNSDGNLYWHQYQQNVSAARNESAEVLKTYKSIDSNLKWDFNFVIPVYNNMPTTKCVQPGSQSIITQNIEIIDESVTVKESKNVSSKSIATLKKGTKILRIEIGNIKTNGYYWDKIVLDNGTKGYIISKGYKLLEDITNCNIKGIATEPGNIRNGPGTTGTTVITTLTVGQSVIIVEKDKYKNINGEDWTRIYLPDGRQGYIVSRYLEEIKDINSTGTTNSGKEVLKVTTSSGLNVREYPGTNQKVLVTIEKGDLLTRTDKNVSNDNGYIWDKVVTEDGIEGYVARGDNDGTYFSIVYNNEITTITGTGVKTSGTNVICNPNITAVDINKITSECVIKDNNGKVVNNGNIGTGYTIKIDGMTYTVVKKGDIDGDGKVTAGDYVKVKNSIMGNILLETHLKLGADVDNDGKVTAGDYVKIKNSIMGKGNISI